MDGTECRGDVGRCKRTYASDTYPSREEETGIRTGAGKMKPPGGCVDVDGRNGKEPNEGRGRCVVEQPVVQGCIVSRRVPV